MTGMSKKLFNFMRFQKTVSFLQHFSINRSSDITGKKEKYSYIAGSIGVCLYVVQYFSNNILLVNRE